MTLANKVTSARFLLSVVYFVLLAVMARTPGKIDPLLGDIAFILFLIVAWTDLLDGYLARKYKEVTPFGRIADPLVDKILVCGSFIFFLSIVPLARIFTPTFVVVILAREFLVSGIRGAAEAAGIPFGANLSGKLKTLIQNVTVGTGLCYATHFVGTGWTETLTFSLMWLTLAATVISGGTYVAGAWKLFISKQV